MKFFSSFACFFSQSKNNISNPCVPFWLLLVLAIFQVVLLTKLAVVRGEYTVIPMIPYLAGVTDEAMLRSKITSILASLEKTFVETLKSVDQVIQNTKPNEEPSIFFTIDDKLYQTIRDCGTYYFSSGGHLVLDEKMNKEEVKTIYVHKVTFNPYNPELVLIGVKDETYDEHKQSISQMSDGDTRKLLQVPSRMHGHLKLFISDLGSKDPFKRLASLLFASNSFPVKFAGDLQRLWERFSIIMYRQAFYLKYARNKQTKEKLFLIFDPHAGMASLLAGQQQYEFQALRRRSTGEWHKSVVTTDVSVPNKNLMKVPIAFKYFVRDSTRRSLKLKRLLSRSLGDEIQIDCFWCAYSNFMQSNGANLQNYVYYVGRLSLDSQITKSAASHREFRHSTLATAAASPSSSAPPPPAAIDYHGKTPDFIRSLEFLAYAASRIDRSSTAAAAAAAAASAAVVLSIPPIHPKYYIELKVYPGRFITTTAMLTSENRDEGVFIVMENIMQARFAASATGYALLNFKLDMSVQPIPWTLVRSRVISFTTAGVVTVQRQQQTVEGAAVRQQQPKQKQMVFVLGVQFDNGAFFCIPEGQQQNESESPVVEEEPFKRMERSSSERSRVSTFVEKQKVLRRSKSKKEKSDPGKLQNIVKVDYDKFASAAASAAAAATATAASI